MMEFRVVKEMKIDAYEKSLKDKKKDTPNPSLLDLTVSK
jgi:hypothetical protein